MAAFMGNLKLVMFFVVIFFMMCQTMARHLAPNWTLLASFMCDVCDACQMFGERKVETCHALASQSQWNSFFLQFLHQPLHLHTHHNWCLPMQGKRLSNQKVNRLHLNTDGILLNLCRLYTTLMGWRVVGHQKQPFAFKQKSWKQTVNYNHANWVNLLTTLTVSYH